MKRNITSLSQRYQTALTTYLKERRWENLTPAFRLGERAVTMRLQTLDLARIHEAAVGALEASAEISRLRRRAARFFVEAIVPIEKIHEAALQADHHVMRLNKALRRRSGHVAQSKRRLKKGIVDRKAMEQALKTSGVHSVRLLKESHHLQENLKHLTRRILSTRETKRKRLSRDLQDEIGQTLLGLNVRLLTLRRQAALDARGLKREIAATQRIVNKSANSIKRVAGRFSKYYEA